MPIKPQAQNLTEFGKYLVTKGISYPQAAAQLGVTRSYVSALALGRVSPGLHLAVRIEDWSEGTITPRTWVGDR